MLAILEDAIACFQKYLFARDSKGKAQFRDTEDWVFQLERFRSLLLQYRLRNVRARS